MLAAHYLTLPRLRRLSTVRGKVDMGHMVVNHWSLVYGELELL
ncbi:MAG: hypothetical protein ACRERU_19940 [Methylococcales bacterium]